MKKFLAFLLAVILVVGTCFAEGGDGNGDTNIDGGGGGDMGEGDGQSAWNPGDEGVRVTILNEGVPVSILDYSNGYRNRVEFSFQKQCNPYSYHMERVHYVPVWYEAPTYPVPLAIFDAWTPGGHLYVSKSDYVEIRGDMYDDWYIRVIE